MSDNNRSKIHVQGSRPDIQVPMTEIRLSDSDTASGPVPK